MLQTLEDYLMERMPAHWMEEFKAIRRKHGSGELTEMRYHDAVNDLVCRDRSDEAMSILGRSLKDDFDMQDCSFTRHFIARLLGRFPGAVMDFLMTSICQLKTRCCKKKRERSRADGITLVMDPSSHTLLTVFAC